MSEQPSQGSAGYGTDSSTRARATEYWRRNIRYVGILLAVWFVVVALIFVYVFLMNRLDREFDLREEDDV